MEEQIRIPQFLQFNHSLCDENSIETIYRISHALASKDRLRILQLLQIGARTITEIANSMYMSVSTATFHLHILRDAGLIDIALMPGKRGHVQLCRLQFDSLHFYTSPILQPEDTAVFIQDVPVGLYTAADLQFISGFCTSEEQIMFDDGNYFDPRRAGAQLIWCSNGFVEYTVSNIHKGQTLRKFSVSLEICSETLYYQIGWKSDITFWLNGRELCTFTSPSDFGGRRGNLNPSWWGDSSTQYGELKQITLTDDGCFFCGVPVVGEQVPKLSDFKNDSSFVLRIGNKPDANFQGGFNIFGRGFGDYPQDIHFEIEYNRKN